MFSASSSHYGDSEVLPKIESMPPLSLSPYAATKVAGEQYIRAYASSYEIDAVSLRYFNIFGPRRNANHAYAGVIAAFARMLLNGQHHHHRRWHGDTRFHVRAQRSPCESARRATSKRLDGDVFNVATAQSFTITQLATEMAELLGRADLTPNYLAPRAAM